MQILIRTVPFLLLLPICSFASNAPAAIPESIVQKEIDKHHACQIEAGVHLKEFEVSEIKERPMQLLYESLDARPQDIFFINYKGHKIIGRKLVSNLFLNKEILGMKCSRITAPMILGVFEREQIVNHGLMLFYRPLHAPEKLALFQALKQELRSDLYFPYPYLDAQNEEAIWPIDFWNFTLEFQDNLDSGEVAFRKCIVGWLSQFDLHGKVLYDPSCSTGRFLSEIKRHYPDAYTIGQDINEKMVEHAKKHSLIDQVYWGNSAESPVLEASVDFIFFRFLNLEVVSGEQAMGLFSSIANRCRDGGYLIVFGHTPVLLSAEWFELLGLEVVQTIGYNKADDSIFQFYILKKIRFIPAINFKHFQFLN